MKWERVLLTTWIFACCALRFVGQGPGQSEPSADGGFSTERLARITKLFQAEVEKGAIPGAVLLVARDGKLVYLQTGGTIRTARKRLAMKGRRDLSDCFDDETGHQCGGYDAG